MCTSKNKSKKQTNKKPDPQTPLSPPPKRQLVVLSSYNTPSLVVHTDDAEVILLSIFTNVNDFFFLSHFSLGLRSNAVLFSPL